MWKLNNILLNNQYLKANYWRRKWQPTPVFLPGESQGRGSLVGCRLWGRTESDMTEATQQQQAYSQQQQVSRSVVYDSATPWTAGHPVHHKLSELTQIYVHRIDDAIQPAHPLSSPSPPAFSLSQHQGLFPISQFFTSGGQSIGTSSSASVLPMDIQG